MNQVLTRPWVGSLPSPRITGGRRLAGCIDSEKYVSETVVIVLR